MINRKSRLITSLTDVTKSANTPWLSSSLGVHCNQNMATRLTVTLAVTNNDSKVKMTLDGSNYAYLDVLEDIKKDVWYNFTFYPAWFCSINFKSGTNTDIVYLAVGEGEHA